jgi:hypothetical protein
MGVWPRRVRIDPVGAARLDRMLLYHSTRAAHERQERKHCTLFNREWREPRRRAWCPVPDTLLHH